MTDRGRQNNVTRRLGRLALAGAMALLAGGATVLTQTHMLAAAPSLCAPATVTGVADSAGGNHFGTPGSTSVTVQGLGFATGGCVVSVEYGVAGHTTTLSGSQISVDSNGTSISFTQPSGPGGPVAVLLTDNFGNASTSNSNYNFWAVPTANLSSSPSPYEKSTISLTGANFTLGGAASGSPQAVVCDAKDPSETTTATVQSDTSLTFPAPSVYCSGGITVTFQAPYNTAPAATDPPVSMPVSAGLLDIGPFVSGFTGSTPTGPGTPVSVSGSGFGPGGSVEVGGHVVPSSWNDSSISFTTPDGDGGQVLLTRSADSHVFTVHLATQSAIASFSPSAAAVGDTVRVFGRGFGSSGSLSVGSEAVTASSWTTDTISFTVPSGATTGQLTVHPAVNLPSSGSSLQVLAKITSANPSSAPPGSLVQLVGSSFGTGMGTISVGGSNARVTLWGDTAVIFTIPSSVPVGSTDITLTPAGGSTGAGSIAYTVTAGAPTGQGGTANGGPGGTAGGGIVPKSGKPVISTGPINFTPQQQTGPVIFALSLPEVNEPGSDIPYTATLTAFGTPVNATNLVVQIAYEPASDAYLSPGTTTTDGKGQVHGFIHFSTTAGAYLIYLSSGTYHWETEVFARTGVTPASSGSSNFFVDHISAPPTLLLFAFLIPLMAVLLLMSRGRALAVAGGGYVSTPVAIPGRREVQRLITQRLAAAWQTTAGPQRRWRRWLRARWAANRLAAWRVIGVGTALFLIAVYLLASISTLTALPLTFFGSASVIPEGTLYFFASLAVSLALTAIAIRYVYYYRCWTVSRHFFSHPEIPDLEALQARGVPYMKVQVTTKGGAVPVVERSLTELKRIVEAHPWLQPKISVEIITEVGSEAAYLQERFARTVLPVEAVTLPPEYETPNGTRLKARALHYLVERRRAGWNRKPGRTFIVHFDEETLVTESHLLVLADYLSRDPRPVSQGPILYPLEWKKTPWICRALECTRPFGCSECARVMENPPPPHLHGSNLVVDEEAENAIGWDFGTIDGQPFIAEDLLFGLKAYSVIGRDAFGWHGATMLEQPPLSLHWAVQQRLRWVMGALQGMRAMNTMDGYDGITKKAKRRLGLSIGYRIATYSLGFPVGFAGLYFLVHPAETATRWGSMAGLWRVLIIASAIGWIMSYQIGILRNMRYQAIDWKERAKQCAVMLIITPIAGLCETAGPFIALLRWLFGARKVSWTPTPKVSDKRPTPGGPTAIATGGHGEGEIIPMPVADVAT